MRFPLIFRGLISPWLAILLATAVWLSATPAGDPAERLQGLVARQRELLAAAEKKTSQHELEDLRQPLQELCYAYEDYLRAFPDQAAGYASYAMLLDHPIIDERRRSTALFLRANQLDSEMALVKNQLGNHLAEDGKPLEAVNYYLAAIRLEPKESLYHYQLGTLLAEARDDFLKSGEWTADKLDPALLGAFREAMTLAPDNWRYAYRYGLAFYDVDQPDWGAALAFWQGFESRLKPGIEQQTCRLHQARVHLARGERDRARAVLDTVTESVLERQKTQLLAEIKAAE